MSIKLWSDGHRGAFAHCVEKKSENIKTGDMLQVAILSVREKPTDTRKMGKHHINCGICPLEKLCYVNVIVYNSVWQHARKGVLPQLKKPVRFGSFGDPAFLPLALIDEIKTKTTGHTGYTHQWANNIDPHYKQTLMASVDGVDGNTREQAKDSGYRTFRILKAGEKTAPGEIICPNSTHGVQCADCLLCDGANGKKDIAIAVHGPPVTRAQWNKKEEVTP
jgi:hypothetical protein